MFAYLLLLVAALSRVAVIPYHFFSFTAIGGSLLYFGARRSKVQIIFPVLLLAATDFYLTKFVYAYPFHARDYAFTWVWYAAACLLGGAMLSKRNGILRILGAAFVSATSFFLLSNFIVWAGSHMYAKSAAGLAACYTAGLPFYPRDLVATAAVAGCAFGIEALVKQIAAMRHPAGTSIAA
jgi:hypothetical protein